MTQKGSRQNINFQTRKQLELCARNIGTQQSFERCFSKEKRHAIPTVVAADNYLVRDVRRRAGSSAQS
jgi:hypothetical protein